MLAQPTDRSCMGNLRIRILTLVCLLGTIGGCAQSTRTHRSISSDYTVAYRSGDYALAAQRASRAPHGDPHADLVEGMARIELHEIDRAESLLEPLLRSPDREIRGRAAASIGLIELQRGDHSQATRQLQIAADSLRGPDSTWAAHYALESLKASGETRVPSHLATKARGAQRVLDPAPAGKYSIQFGSFSTQARAQRHAQSVSRLTRTSGLSDPTVETVRRGARTLYSVRTGSFQSRSAATQAALGLHTDTAVIQIQ